MEEALIQFAKNNSLTARERDVVRLMLDRVVSLKDIAQSLSLSPHTINSHFKKIFEKTGTRSRSELLALLLKFSVEHLNSCAHLHRAPRVVIVDDEPELSELVSNSLSFRGIKTYAYTDPQQVLDDFPKHQFDVLISDIRMPGVTGIDLLQEIRKRNWYSPAVLFMSGYANDYEAYDVINLGAATLIEKPFDLERLFALVMEQFIEAPHDRGRYFRMNSKIPITVNGKLQLTTTDIGFGGGFIPFIQGDDSSNHFNVEVGTVLSFEFGLEEFETPISAKGEVVWRRTQQENGLSPGVGVKFLDLSSDANTLVQDFVRMNRILSFIPSGRKVA